MVKVCHRLLHLKGSSGCCFTCCEMLLGLNLELRRAFVKVLLTMPQTRIFWNLWTYIHIFKPISIDEKHN